MSKILVLAEKPSVGRDIGRVLKCTRKVDGGLEGDRYVVTWGLGHLVTLQDPEDYNPDYKVWKMEDLPMMPEPLKVKVIPQTGKQYHAVRKLLGRKDVDSIVIATDAGREGELVARWILKQAGCQKPCKRLWISSVTDKAILQGFQKLKDAKEYDSLYQAAVSRAEADWLVGINATRALTCKHNAQLSCGRVQTPTLAMIAAREQEIRQFRPESFYGLQAMADGRKFTWHDTKSGSASSFDQERMQQLKKNLTGKPMKIQAVSKKEQQSTAPQLYDLTELQRDANVKFGFSAKETLNIMQRLYENYKILTYPRTDSRYLTTDLADTLKERIEACSVGPYRTLAVKLRNQRWSTKLPIFNNAKVSDHHAIIPTEEYVPLTDLSGNERKIYDLVVRRFLAVLYPPCRTENLTVTGQIEKELFTAKGERILEMGWRTVYSENDSEKAGETVSKDWQQGKLITNVTLTMTDGKTKPPAHFTEATLLTAMENPVKFMQNKDKEMAKVLGETGGLGTVATRADIIEKLFNSFLIEKKDNAIYLTSKARQLLELVPEDLKKPEMTASWEKRLSEIAAGKEKRNAFMREIKSYTKDIMGEIQQSDSVFRHDNLTQKKCPECGKRLLLVQGKNAKMYVCQDRNCGYKETIARVTNARCPKCHKKMNMSGKGETAIFFCSCGYKEKLSKFEERRKQEGGGVKKKDVARYLNQQKKEAQQPLNNAFADAFKNLKINE